MRDKFFSIPSIEPLSVISFYMAVEASIATHPTSFRALQQSLFSLLHGCNSIKNISEIHAQIVINGLSQKNFILVKLLTLYIASGHLVNACRAFGKIEIPSTTVWNQMIRGHAWGGMPRKSVELYNRMEAAPDGFTYSFVISACARSGLLTEGQQMHGKVVSNGFWSNVFVQTNLVNLYAMDGRGLGDARQMFDEMSERNIVTWNSLLVGYLRNKDIDAANRIFDEMPERSVVSWTTMIAGCAQNGKHKQALSLFHEMRRANVELDQVALVAALSACAGLGDLKLGRWIHSYIGETFWYRNQPVLVSLNNALIHMYASCGLVEEAYKVFLDMPRRTSVSWTSMITGFAKQGRGEEALRIFYWMQCSGANEARPDEITFLGVLSACSHAGLVDEGRQLFKCMNQIWSIKPRIEHYGCMVDLLSRAGFLDEAYSLVEAMPMKPNYAVWGAILGGCRIHKNVELASHVARNLAIELDDPDQAAGYLVLLLNLYAATRKWLDVATVRQKMVEMGVKKPPGRSWVQTDGVIHEFLADDMTHKDTYLIYKLLGEITASIKCDGYKPGILEVILDNEE